VAFSVAISPPTAGDVATAQQCLTDWRSCSNTCGYDYGCGYEYTSALQEDSGHKSHDRGRGCSPTGPGPCPWMDAKEEGGTDGFLNERAHIEGLEVSD